MKNKLFLLLCLIASTTLSSYAEVPVLDGKTVPQKPTVQTQQQVVSTSFENCVKIYNTSVDNLYYLTLAAINSNGYKIDEIQSRTGLISFVTGTKVLLASITEISVNSSMIKITPADNSYAFAPTIPENIFTYLSNHVK